MAEQRQLTYDDVHAAFRTNQVLVESDERLMEYLRLLCTTNIGAEANQLLANNRCITINTILTRRFMERVDRATTRYTILVIVLALATLAVAVGQLWISWRGGA